MSENEWSPLITGFVLGVGTVWATEIAARVAVEIVFAVYEWSWKRST